VDQGCLSGNGSSHHRPAKGETFVKQHLATLCFIVFYDPPQKSARTGNGSSKIVQVSDEPFCFIDEPLNPHWFQLFVNAAAR
jgi:hypothetical protein